MRDDIVFDCELDHGYAVYYVTIDGVRHDCLPKLVRMLEEKCTNGKEQAEMTEYMAYQIFVEESVRNDDYFA